MLTKKMTKRVYFNGEWWKVERVFSPTKYDDYILVSRKSETTCHDGGTIPVEMALIDCHNNEFYPDTETVRGALERLAINEARRSREDEAKKTLSRVWLDMVHTPSPFAVR